jgi:hypothetical protein
MVFPYQPYSFGVGGFSLNTGVFFWLRMNVGKREGGRRDSVELFSHVMIGRWLWGPGFSFWCWDGRNYSYSLPNKSDFLSFAGLLRISFAI